MLVQQAPSDGNKASCILTASLCFIEIPAQVDVSIPFQSVKHQLPLQVLMTDAQLEAGSVFDSAELVITLPPHQQ